MAFEENERVLAWHHNLLYEAKVLKVDSKLSPPKYLIHYQGWNKKHDEFLLADKVLKWNEGNLNLQRALQAQVTVSKAMKKDEPKPAEKVTGKRTGSPPPSGKQTPRTQSSQKKDGKRRKQDDAASPGPDNGIDIDDVPKRTDIRLDIPLVLKQQLVEDGDRITKEKKLVPLPREPSVLQLLDQFAKSLPRSNGGPDYMAEILEGLRTYFNESLGTLLLYKFERAQYASIREEYSDRQMAEIYGPEHLLRLFIKLPALIGMTNMDDESVRTVLTLSEQLLQFMTQKAPSIFLRDYEIASTEYVRTAQRE